jgi:hypothetical protein
MKSNSFENKAVCTKLFKHNRIIIMRTETILDNALNFGRRAYLDANKKLKVVVSATGHMAIAQALHRVDKPPASMGLREIGLCC